MKRTLFLTLAFCLLISQNIFAEEPKNESKKYIAIVIDDFGCDYDDIDEMIALDIAFTGAVIPGHPSSSAHMEMLIANGKDVIIHLPMEPLKGAKKSWHTPMSLYVGLDATQVSERVDAALKELTQVSGINNHMGSKATSNEQLMGYYVQAAKNHDFIILDSLTNSKSKLKDVATQQDAKFLIRDVFLDDPQKRNVSFVERRMKEAADIADKNGYAIAIGHVGRSGGMTTIEGIKKTAKDIEARGIEFVTLKQLYEIIEKQTISIG